MVTFAGKCPHCGERTTPGVGARAGLWICVPCQLVFDKHGQLQTTPLPRRHSPLRV